MDLPHEKADCISAGSNSGIKVFFVADTANFYTYHNYSITFL